MTGSKQERVRSYRELISDGRAIEAVFDGSRSSAEAPGGKVVLRTQADYARRRGFPRRRDRTGSGDRGDAQGGRSACLAPIKPGGTRLDCQNFSMMHGRRPALITALSVTKEPKLCEPELDRPDTRKGPFCECWFPDRRLDETYQLQDVFYSEDASVFDSGHITRRDAAVWGKTFEPLPHGNVDSFHVSNCSPRPADARVSEGIAAYGFLLEQDLLAAVFLEFAVAEAFVVKMRPLAEVATLAQITLAALAPAADRHQTRGIEIACRAGTNREDSK